MQRTIALFISIAALAFEANAQSGPTPYPQDEASWPGKGPVRVFDWMRDNRSYFWTQREKAQGTVVFVGDSLIGNWKSPSAAFPNRKITNRGIGGDVSRGLLFRFKEDVLDLNPKAILILVGTNDLSAKANVEDVISNLKETLALRNSLNPKPPVILCTVPPRESSAAPIDAEQLLELNRQIKQLESKADGVTVLDVYALLVEPGGTGKPQAEYFQKDRLHLAAPGYSKIAEAAGKLLPAPPATP